MSSIFTSRNQITLSVPFDPGHTITIRQLAPRHLHMAAQADQLRSIDDLRAIGGAAFMKEMKELFGDEKKADRAVDEAKKADPMLGFDPPMLCLKGVMAWSYDQKVGEPATFEDLNAETTDWLAREILKLSKPSLFQTAEEQEADKKKDQGSLAVA